MKNVTLILCLFIGLNGFAQDPELLDTNWYIQSLTFGGTTTLEPIFNPNSTFFFENPDDWQYSYCDGIRSPLSYIGQDSFEILDDFPIILLGVCTDQTIISFGSSFQRIFYNANGAINPFNYSIETNGGIKTLIVTNGEGDIATYRSEPLATIDENKQRFISLFPNPAKDQLTLSLETIDTANVTIYNILGNKVMETSITTSSSQLQIETLKAGVYLMNVVASDGQRQTLKFIKE